MKIKHLIEQLVLEELEKYKIGGDSAIPAGPVKLYHISDTEGIKRFDPKAAAKGKKGYSSAGYETWDQPRVFFFTKKGQLDGGFKKIQGDHIYVVELDRSELYDINKDDPNYYADWDRSKKRYIEITGHDPTYPVNQFDLIKALLEKDAPNVKGFLLRQGPKKEPVEEENTIAALWEPVEPSGVITPEEYYEKQK